MTNTNDLNKFGYREYEMASQLLKLLSIGQWESEDEQLGDGIKLEFNTNSGNVFLVDDNSYVVMVNDSDKLENWLSCSNCGAEGYRSDGELGWINDYTCKDCKDK